jgi:hypothetical protein
MNAKPAPDNHWLISLGMVTVPAPSSYPNVASVYGGASLAKHDLPKALSNSLPRQTKKSQIVRLFNPGKSLDTIARATGIPLKHVRNTLIAMRKIEKAHSCGRKGIPVIKLSLQGGIIKEFASMTDAASALGIDRRDIY